MDAFSLLRYWRSNGGDATTNADVTTSTATSTTIVTAVISQTSETPDEEGEVVSEDNDNGPFFDLEFSLPAEEAEGEGGDGEGEDEYLKNGVDYGEEDEEEESDGSDEVEDESELKFTLLSGSSGDSTADVNVSVSPSDDLFFKGGFVNVDHTAEIDSKPLQTRVSLMKSATKIRVMMLKFKKSKSKSKFNGESTETTDSNSNTNTSNVTNSKEEHKKNENQNVGSEDSGKSMAVKCKVEGVPIVSLFRRHNSSKSPKKPQIEDESVSSSSEEKKFSKEAMQKYLRKVKPLYVRVSKRYGEKLKLTGQLSLPRVTITKPNPAPSPANEKQKQSPAANPRGEKESTSEVSEPPLLQSNNIKALKQGNLPAGLRVVCKHLRKSRSASTAVVAAAPGAVSSQRRDDSLLQQQDGIQSAILHCKRSFKASRDVDCSSSSSGEAAPPCAADEKETEEINKR